MKKVRVAAILLATLLLSPSYLALGQADSSLDARLLNSAYFDQSTGVRKALEDGAYIDAKDTVNAVGLTPRSVTPYQGK